MRKLEQQCNARCFPLKGRLLFLRGNCLLIKINRTLHQIEDIHKHSETCQTIATYGQNTVDVLVDLTQELASLDVQQEMNTRLQELHKIIIKLASRPRPDIQLKFGTLSARDFFFRISDALKLLCETRCVPDRGTVASALLNEFGAFYYSAMSKLAKYMSKDEVNANIFDAAHLLYGFAYDWSLPDEIWCRVEQLKCKWEPGHM